MTDINVIADKLSALTTAYTSLYGSYYDLFINTTAKDVTLKAYDIDGVLQTVTVPNRAKDKVQTVISSGNGSPEGSIVASIGAFYIDKATVPISLYYKSTGEGNTGWALTASQSNLNTHIADSSAHTTYLANKTGNSTQTFNVNTPTADTHATTKAYVDRLHSKEKLPTISNNSISLDTLINFSSGYCYNSTDTTLMVNTNTVVKNLDSTWVQGSNNGGLDTGMFSNSTSYSCFIISNATGTLTDFLFSLSATSPNMTLPISAGFTLFRRIGSIMTDSGATIKQFIQDGDLFEYKTPVMYDVATDTLGTTAVNYTVPTPVGLTSKAIINVKCSGTLATSLYISNINTDDSVATSHPTLITHSTDSSAQGNLCIQTNNLAQIRFRASNSNTVVRASVLGYIDTRGRN